MLYVRAVVHREGPINLQAELIDFEIVKLDGNPAEGRVLQAQLESMTNGSTDRAAATNCSLLNRSQWASGERSASNPGISSR